MSEQNYFTIDEIKIIERNLGFITRGWYENLVRATINLAMQKGISQLYWNSSETLNSGNTQEGKVDFFYERLPQQMGFKQVFANLRGKGNERLWYMNLRNNKFSSENSIDISQIPRTRQGAVIQILKHNGPYSKQELRRVFDIIKNKKKKKNKITEAFFYKTMNWSGDQRFREDRDEIVLTQKLTKETFDSILNTNDPTFEKFLSLILSAQQHFGQDTLGFVLICPIDNNNWIINEIQTDNLNLYMKEKIKVEQKNKEMKDNTLDEQSISDMLTANDKSIWIPKLSNENFLRKIQENPNIIDSLPNNQEVEQSGGLDLWIEQNSESQTVFRLTKNFKIIKC